MAPNFWHQDLPREAKGGGDGVGATKLRQPPLHPYIRRPPPPSTTHNTQEPLSLSHLHYVVLGSSGAKARAFWLVVLSNSSGRLAPTFGLRYGFVLNLSLLYLYRA
jgi:hypothetical protein